MVKNNEAMFDHRVVERNVAHQLITRAEYEQYLKSLPDDSEEVEEIALEDE